MKRLDQGRRTLKAALVAAALLALWLVPAAGQEKEDCLACHSDNSLEGSRKGKKISVFVDEKKFGGLVHASVS